jgi:hypothetical protein
MRCTVIRVPSIRIRPPQTSGVLASIVSNAVVTTQSPERFEPPTIYTPFGPLRTVEAELAAGQICVDPSFVSRSRCLGLDAEIEILVGPDRECLLGTDLLNPQRLEIDFRTRTVRIISDKHWLTEP